MVAKKVKIVLFWKQSFFYDCSGASKSLIYSENSCILITYNFIIIYFHIPSNRKIITQLFIASSLQQTRKSTT